METTIRPDQNEPAATTPPQLRTGHGQTGRAVRRRVQSAIAQAIVSLHERGELEHRGRGLRQKAGDLEEGGVAWR